MPVTEFICTDGKTTPITECLKGCRICDQHEAGRCMALPTLKSIAEQREWKGVPSTTMLLNGTRYNVLTISENYPINPDDMIWAVFGTGVHSAIEDNTPDNALAEERLYDEYSSGSFDYYEQPNLFDYKTYGSFKTAKLLGLKKLRIPVYGDDGKQKKYRNGRLVYDDKWIIGHKSRMDVAIQLNDYRMKLQKAGFPVENQFVQVLTRDGGTFVAKGRGIERNSQLVKINMISDRWIERYMRKKANDLAYWLQRYKDTGELPPPCSCREMWGGKKVFKRNPFNGKIYEVEITPGLKCQRYCAVWYMCDMGIKARKSKPIEKELD